MCVQGGFKRARWKGRGNNLKIYVQDRGPNGGEVFVGRKTYVCVQKKNVCMFWRREEREIRGDNFNADIQEVKKAPVLSTAHKSLLFRRG